MTTFDDEFDAVAADALMDEFGESATYHPVSGDDVALTVLPTDEQVEERQENDRLVKYRTLAVTISTDPAGDYGGVAAPSVLASVTYGGAKYAIEGVQDTDGSFVDLKLARPELVEHGRPQYRGRRY